MNDELLDDWMIHSLLFRDYASLGGVWDGVAKLLFVARTRHSIDNVVFFPAFGGVLYQVFRPAPHVSRSAVWTPTQEELYT